MSVSDNILKQTDDDLEKEWQTNKKMKLDAKNLLITLVLILVMIAIPQIESSRKKEIANIFGTFLQFLTPITDCGMLGILFYSSLVSLWDGISLVPVRYVEFLVALSFNSI